MTQAPDGDDDALLTTRQAAAKLNISLSTLMRLIYAGELETIRMPPVNLDARKGGRPRNGSRPEHRIEPAEIERFKDRNRQRVGA